MLFVTAPSRTRRGDHVRGARDGTRGDAWPRSRRPWLPTACSGSGSPH